MSTMSTVFLDKIIHRALFGGSLDWTALNIACSGVVALALAFRDDKYTFWFRMPVLTFFGDISYGLCLIHMLVFYAFNAVQDWLFPWAPHLKGHFEVFLVRFLVSFPSQHCWPLSPVDILKNRS